MTEDDTKESIKRNVVELRKDFETHGIGTATKGYAHVIITSHDESTKSLVTIPKNTLKEVEN